MDKSRKNFFKQLIETPSPSGFEVPVQRLFRDRMKAVAGLDVQSDVMGNVFARTPQKEGKRTVALLGHSDEIGLMVKAYEMNYLRVAQIGGGDAHQFPGKRVFIHTKNGPVLGVINRNHAHLMEAAEREKVMKVKDMLVDIGAKDEDELKEMVAIGDPITITYGFDELLNNIVACRAADDRAGVLCVAGAMEDAVAEGTADCVNLVGISTVQEEIGLRGATTACYSAQPDVVIAIDVGFAVDYPGANVNLVGNVGLGKGPKVARGANVNPILFDILVETAKENDIPIQVTGEPRATGTDANVAQLSREGTAAALLSIPLRSMHSPSELVCLDDMDNLIKLIVKALPAIGEAKTFLPLEA